MQAAQCLQISGVVTARLTSLQPLVTFPNKQAPYSARMTAQLPRFLALTPPRSSLLCSPVESLASFCIAVLYAPAPPFAQDSLGTDSRNHGRYLCRQSNRHKTITAGIRGHKTGTPLPQLWPTAGYMHRRVRCEPIGGPHASRWVRKSCTAC